MWYGGAPVGNVYLYDAQGHRLTDVRAFTDDGRPLDLSKQRLGPDGSPIPPVADKFGTEWSNVLPISETPGADPWEIVDGTDGRWRAPTVLAPLGDPTPTPSPTVTSSARPTTSPKSTPVPSPTGTATGK
jgi:hypothetical protein